MGGDETTPVKKHRTGEYPDHGLIEWMQRIESKIDKFGENLNKHIIEDTKVEMRLQNIEKDSESKRQFRIGAWLAIIGVVASPVLTWVIFAVKHTP